MSKAPYKLVDPLSDSVCHKGCYTEEVSPQTQTFWLVVADMLVVAHRAAQLLQAQYLMGT